MSKQGLKNIFPLIQDVRAYTDELRAHHQVFQNEAGEWEVLGHSAVVYAATHPEIFSSQVSRFLQIPNGLDGAEHQAYRRLIEKYLTPDALVPFIPAFRSIAEQMIQVVIDKGQVINAVDDLGAVYAVRAQCAWLGWPAYLEPQLLSWIQENYAAIRSGQLNRTRAVAEKFDTLIQAAINHYKQYPSPENAKSITERLLEEKMKGQRLTEEVCTSILRNWTGGDLGSMSLCIGVVVAHLVTGLQQNANFFEKLNALSDVDLNIYIDEILRLDNPFVSNRRMTRCPVQIEDQLIPKDAIVRLNWTSANRDEGVFGIEKFNPQRHQSNNLVYGVGPHVCPGRTLATWQLNIFTRTLLSLAKTLEVDTSYAWIREQAPVGGYKQVPVKLIKKC